MNPLKQLVKHGLGCLLPSSRYVLNGPRQARDIALTFDDGPHPTETAQVLDLLQELGIRGTFFVVGQRAAESPELIERIVAEGHTLGHHSWSHSEPRDTSAAQLAAEILRTQELLRGIVGFAPQLFRPPKGMLTFRKMQMLWQLNQRVVLWNVDPRDYAVVPPENLDVWSEAYHPTAGDLVLFHDIHAHCRRAIRNLAGRPEFCRDWKFCTLEDWFPEINRCAESRSLSSQEMRGNSVSCP